MPTPDKGNSTVRIIDNIFNGVGATQGLQHLVLYFMILTVF